MTDVTDDGNDGNDGNDDIRYMPPDHCMQVGSNRFRFDIITSSQAFNGKLDQLLDRGLYIDICDPSLSHLTEEELREMKRSQYKNVVQKSPSWLTLRSWAHGTGSSLGKYLKAPPMYPTKEQISEEWVKKIDKEPFNKTHTMLGHMSWGVGYEDPALIHFALNQNVKVLQVGTVRIDLKEMLLIGKSLGMGTTTTLKQRLNLTDKGGDDLHLLVSPDGVVTDLDDKPIGMLEIKCMSPFHYMEVAGEWLEWAADMEARQWYCTDDIPFVYLVQLGLQALVGLTEFSLDENSIMWFIRWSPHGFSKFWIPFRVLLQFGVSCALLYFSLLEFIDGDKNRIDIMFPYKGRELHFSKMVNKYYNIIIDEMQHIYIPIDDYPEFDVYHKCTEFFRFKVEEMDSSQLQTDFSRNKGGDGGDGNGDGHDLDSCLL